MNDGQFDSYSCRTETKPTHTHASARVHRDVVSQRKWINKNHPNLLRPEQWLCSSGTVNNENATTAAAIKKEEEIL